MLREGVPSTGTKQHAFFPLIALLAAAFVAGCATTDNVVTEAAPADETELRETTERAVIATTGASPGAEATVGVASTAGQAEVAPDETASVASADESSTVSPSARPSEVPFIVEPQISGGEGYGADGILGVRYGLHDGYERVVVDLGAGGRPAGSVPEWVLSSPTGSGVLRVTTPSVSTTRVSEGNFGGPLLKNFHVVRAPEGGMFVDIFAGSAFSYRVLELLEPSRLVIDFKPSEADLDLPLPAETGNTVLVEPRRGAAVGGSLTLSGYSRNPEASNTIVLTDASGRELIRDNVSSNDWTTTWGYFETTLDLPPFDGRATLRVGAMSARDGTFEGVEIPVYGSG